MNNSETFLQGSGAPGSPTQLATPAARRARPDQAERLESAVLRELVERLQARERSRAAWTALVIHELRRPLTTIDLSAQILEESLSHPGGQLRERLENIRWATQLMAGLTSDLLDMSSIEANAFQIEPTAVRIASLVQDAIAHLPGLAATCRLQIEPGADVVLSADPRRIEQVLGNLLDNAAKYGDPASKIDVDLVRQEGHVRVTVSSRGPGICAERLPRVFERFERGGKPRAEKPGLGLGLYIARAIVEAHGGRIWVRSAPSVITQFYFTLPLSAPR